MHKRRTRVFALFVLAALTTSRAAVAGVTIGIGHGTGAPGGNVQVPISMTGAGSGVAGVQFDLALPPGVLAPADPTTACALVSNVPGTVNTVGIPGGIRLLLYDSGGRTYANGTLATCTFAVAVGAAFGTYPLDLGNLMVSDSNANVVTSTAAAGWASVCTGCCP
jgi:hypothetical protein